MARYIFRHNDVNHFVFEVIDGSPLYMGRIVKLLLGGVFGFRVGDSVNPKPEFVTSAEDPNDLLKEIL